MERPSWENLPADIQQAWINDAIAFYPEGGTPESISEGAKENYKYADTLYPEVQAPVVENEE